MSGSIIRKITRGTSSANGDVTISCSITDTDKVIVILNSDNSVTYTTSGNFSSAGGGNVYLKSISNSNIVVCGHGTGTGTYKYSGTTYYVPTNNGSISFSYQIIEFM